MQVTIRQFVRALSLGAAVLAAGQTIAAPPASGTVNSNVAAGSNAASDGSINANVAGAPNAAAPNGAGTASGMGNGSVGIAPNGIWPYGVAPNAGENGVTTARPAAPAPNPALYPNLNANRDANVNPNMNPSRQNGAGLWRQSSPAASNGFAARNYNSQSFSQFNNYHGRTFARGNPQYFGIRRYYANGNYFSGFRAGQGR